MQTRNPLLDDLARLASGGLGVASGLRREMEDALGERLNRLLADRGLVSREEFEVVQAMATLAREENAALKTRIEALEQALEKAQVQGVRPAGAASTRKAGAGGAPRRRRSAQTARDEASSPGKPGPATPDRDPS